MSAVFQALGLAADADERAVKRAYAQRLKSVRPDTDPVGFQRLHEQYQAALDIVRRRKPIDAEEAAAKPVATEANAAPAVIAIPTNGATDVALEPAHFVPDDTDFPAAPVQVEPTLHLHFDAEPIPNANADATRRLHVTFENDAQAVPDAPPRPALHLNFDADPAPDLVARPRTQVPPKHLDFKDEAPPREVRTAAQAKALDFASFYSQLLCTARSGSAQPVIDFLQAEPALWSLQQKTRCGKRLLDTLRDEKAGMSLAAFGAVLHFFDLDNVQSGQDGLKMQALQRLLQLRWEFAEQDAKECLRRIVSGREDAIFRSPKALENVRDLIGPHSWLRFFVRATLPGNSAHMLQFMRALFGVSSPVLPESIDRRWVTRRVEVANTDVAGDLRIVVLVFRCLLFSLMIALGGSLLQVGLGGANVGVPIAMLMSAIAVFFLNLLLWRRVRNWQNAIERSDAPTAWMRWAFLPGLAIAGVALHHQGFVASAISVLGLAMGFAISRWRARRGLPLIAIGQLTFLPLLLVCLGWTVFLTTCIRYAEFGACAVLLAWSLDLGRHLAARRASKKP